MSVNDKQTEFLEVAAVLILVAKKIGKQQGYIVTGGDLHRDDRCDYGHPDSLHREALAIDLNIIKDGALVHDQRFHTALHNVWLQMGGNPMIEWDSNHYSWPHRGMR